MIDANNFNSMLSSINQVEKSNLIFEHTIKIHFLRNFTIEPIENFLKFHFYQSRINPVITYSDYNAILQEILDPTSPLLTQKPDIIILSLFEYSNELFSSTKRLDEMKENIEKIYNQLAQKTDALILVNTNISPSYSSLISISTEIQTTSLFHASLNYFIRNFVAQNNSRFILMDWERYLQLLGENECMDYRYWYMNKAPFKKDFLNCYAKDVARIAKVIKGKSKKCLILDCDNTLWGGIIGEDGLQDIKLDDYEYPGKIFHDFQQSVLSLYNQGVIVVLCSKNNEEDVWQVFDNHPACVLKREHIVAHRINWNDKATNITEIANELNLGLDSVVFVDDSPLECNLVKKLLPSVTVLQVPQNLYSFPQLLFKEELFDILSMNDEDKKRPLMYQQEAGRRESAKQFENIEDYLRDLELTLHIYPVKPSEISRIAQLTQKTNQFNLSVKRYTESEIKYFCESDTSKVFSLVAKDRYGDYGLTGALIASRYNDSVRIDSFLLSCRILSRRIEYAFLFNCLQLLHDEWALTHCFADFFPTNKNSQIKDFLFNTGFNFKEEKEMLHIYELNGMPMMPKIDFIQIELENNK